METKLTAKDLMIGDWVYRPDCYDKVVEVRKDTILGSDPLRGLIPIADLQPIPLTAEVLEKNGWTKPASGRIWSRNNVPSFVLEEIDDGSFEITTDTCSEFGGLCVIRYVHQIQNALRLCKQSNN
jgi:hypothetical protein